jgi:hypothetical protein
MRRVCCVCGIEYGVKPPFDDRVTHGLCRRCLPIELRRLKKELAAFVNMVPKDSEQNTMNSKAAI